MSISIESEKLVTFGGAAKFLPQNRRPSYATWWRWWRHGRHGVRLETVVIGGRRLTSVEAVQRFFDRLTAHEGAPTESRMHTVKQREREKSRADNALAKAGILTAVDEAQHPAAKHKAFHETKGGKDEQEHHYPMGRQHRQPDQGL